MGPSSPASAAVAARTPHGLALRVPPARDGAGGKVWEGRSPKLPWGPLDVSARGRARGPDRRQPGPTAQPELRRLQRTLHQLPGPRGAGSPRAQLSPAGLGAPGARGARLPQACRWSGEAGGSLSGNRCSEPLTSRHRFQGPGE